MKKNGEFVGVDEKFIPEEEKYVDESLLGNKEESDKKVKKIAKGIGIGYIAMMFIPVIIFIVGAIFMFTTFGKVNMNNSGIRVNYLFEQYQGTNDGRSVRDILDKVVTHNKTNDYIVTVVYNGNIATSEDDIVAMKYQIVDSGFKEYELSIDYDQKGRANKITIRDVIK